MRSIHAYPSRCALALAGSLAATLLATPAIAKPIAPNLFCDTYAAAPVCLAGLPACTFCHDGAPPLRNRFGMSVEAQLLPGTPRPLSDADFSNAFAGALAAAEDMDADGDGFTSVDEITAGTFPAERNSFPQVSSCPPFNRDGDWDVCYYDPKFVFKKLRLDFCGRSPTYDELQTFLAEADSAASLDRELDVCLDSEFWLGKNGQLWQLAHRKIRPLQAIKEGEDAGQIPLADYYDDYNLFVYSQIDDNDAREVLTADYYVRRAGTNYTIGQPEGQQGVTPNRRAGMLTTRWNLVYNVMFTALPRTAAAQAYRSFLGKDIARLEGLMAIPNEPRDFDGKGVNDQDTCRYCHSTLDPLSYPFRNYNALTGDIGQYEVNRIENNFAGEAPNITQIPETGFVLGRPVANLTEWAQVAANSNEFAAATVMDYWKLLLGDKPRAADQAEFDRLWADLRSTHNYRVERMLHDLIKTEAYGVP